jgi:hypothetical protein
VVFHVKQRTLAEVNVPLRVSENYLRHWLRRLTRKQKSVSDIERGIVSAGILEESQARETGKAEPLGKFYR